MPFKRFGFAELSRSSWHGEENITTLQCFKWPKLRVQQTKDCNNQVDFKC